MNGQPLKVLIVEDNEDDVMLLARELTKYGWDLTYDVASCSGDMVRYLGTQQYDIVISDYAMPGFSGLEALRLVQAHDVNLPFIIMSGTIGEETAVKVMRAGAHDYIMKHHLALLAPAVERELQEAVARRKHRLAEAKLDDYQKRLKSLASELSLAEERERRRIAEGLHDDICQKLALAKLELQSFQHTLADVRLIKQLEHQCEIVDDIIQSAHSLTFELSNPVLYEVGLAAAAESWLAKVVKGRYGIEYELDATPQTIKPAEAVRVFLFQSLRELITNVIKHAKATHLSIGMYRSGDQVHVTVQDNGVGFDLSQVQTTDTGGFGLFSVQERLAYLGGELLVDSHPNQGTRITMIVPWEIQESMQPHLVGPF